MKIVLDTNVLISGLLSSKSVPGQIIQAWRKNCFVLVLCEFQWHEIIKVLHYPKIRKILKWDEAQINEYACLLGERCEWVNVTNIHVTVPNDPADEPILASLIAAQADYLISGDQDLLVLRETYPIIKPAEFIELIQ